MKKVDQTKLDKMIGKIDLATVAQSVCACGCSCHKKPAEAKRS